jgi:rhomboid protease GluP
MTTPQPPQEEITPSPDPRDQEISIPLQTERLQVIMPQRTPYVTYGLIALTVIVFILQIGTEALLGVDLPVNIGIKFNPLIDQGQYWRLLTAMLLHGDILHIGFNMYALFILGRGLENFYGHGRFLLLYILGGLAGTTASYLLTANPSLGASTATFGLLAAYGVLAYRNKQVFGRQSQMIVRNVVQVALINLLLGLTPGIDNWGHAGGALGGLMLAWFAGPELGFRREGLTLQIEDRRTLGEYLMAFLVFFGFFAALALLLDGKA